jgi:hypothetical protein
MEIKTNNVPRDVIEAYELSPDERKEFDYLDWDKIEAGEDSASFMRYKGEIYDLGDIERAPSALSGWDGYIPETHFSGIVLRYCPDTNYEQVIVGRYCV